MRSRYLFDSHALLAFFQKEDGAAVVAKILRKALKQQMDRFICVINLGEIIYMTKRRFGDNKKLEILGRVQQLSFKVLPAPKSLVFKAAELKAEYPISYADCFALACALEHSATLVTGDPEFKKVAPSGRHSMDSITSRPDNCLTTYYMNIKITLIRDEPV